MGIPLMHLQQDQGDDGEMILQSGSMAFRRGQGTGLHRGRQRVTRLPGRGCVNARIVLPSVIGYKWG